MKITMLPGVRFRVSFWRKKLILQVNERQEYYDSTLAPNVNHIWRDAKVEDVTKLYNIKFFKRDKGES